MHLKSRQEYLAHDPQLEARIRNLFPLPLTPFELFMLLDDRPELPMTFCVEMVFRGRLDRDALEAAVGESVARHPLLRAHVAWNHRYPVWKLVEVDSAPVTWLGEESRLLADEIRPLDLRQNTGLRVFATDGDTQSSISLHFHHACCDGLGARRFVVDLITAYARACSVHPMSPAWDNLDYESLRRRQEFGAKAASRLKETTSVWQKLHDAFHFHVLTPQPLASGGRAPTGPVRTTPIQKFAFGSQETARLRQLARDSGSSLNDVAMALLFVTLADWNRRFAAAPASQRLRVLMPTDLRSVQDDRMPAANRMSFSFIARTIGQCQPWESLLAGIRGESQYIQQVRIGRDFLGGISLAQQVPGLLPLLLRLPRCLATAVLSNSGDPTKRFRRRFPADNDSVVIGNVVLERVFGTPPIRPYVHAGFGLCVCARQLCISMLGNNQVLGNQVDELLQSYVNHWRMWGQLP